MSRADTERAVRTAVAIAREHEIDPAEPTVVSERHGVLVHLAPAPVLARVGIDDILGPEFELTRGAVAFARYLSEAGAPVVPPSDLLPAGPFERDGIVVAFWRFVEDRRDLPFDALAAGEGLARIHELGLAYDGELEPFWPPEEAEKLLNRVRLREDERALLRRRLDALALPDRPVQPLHGDAHIWNCVRTPEGPLWIDFDQACRGPLEWDAATMIESSLVWGPFAAVEDAYAHAFGGRFSEETLAPFIELRVILIVEWLAANLSRYPELRDELDGVVAWLRSLER